MSKKELPIVDILKLIFSLCIVSLHSGLYNLLPERSSWYIVHLIVRLAVPYYFIATGYFLGINNNKAENKQKKKIQLKSYSQKMFLPVLVWGTFGLIKNIGTNILKGKSVIYIILDAARHFVFYPSNAMWFCLACIIGAWLIYYFCIKNSNIHLAIFTSAGGYLMLLLFNTYYWVISETMLGWIGRLAVKCMVSFRNGFTFGFIFMLFGYLIANGAFSRISIKIVWMVLAFSFLTLVMEVTLVYGKEILDDNSVFLSFVLFIPSLFIASISYSPKINKKLSLLFRKLSSGYYFLHATLFIFIKSAFKLSGIKNTPILTFTVTIFLATVIILIVQNSKNKIICKFKKII